RDAVDGPADHLPDDSPGGRSAQTGRPTARPSGVQAPLPRVADAARPGSHRGPGSRPRPTGRVDGAGEPRVVGRFATARRGPVPGQWDGPALRPPRSPHAG